MPYVGKKPADIIATSVDTDTGAFSGNVTAGGTLGVTGAVTANAGVVVDNITIDGTEIDLSSGDLTVDVAGDLILDVDGGDVHFQDAGSSNRFMSIKNSSGSAVFSNPFADGDITFQGNDNGVGVVTPLTLDMSTGGTATFAKNVTITDGNLVVASGHGIDFSATSNSSGSMSGELFSDYEEGAWTPTYTGSGGNPTATYDAQQFGFYTRIGRKVFIIGRVRTDAVSGGSGVLQVSGLPYTVNSSLNSDNFTSGGGIVSDAFGSNNPHSTMMIAGSTSFYCIYGNYNVNQISDLQDGSNKNQIQFSFFYIAA